MFLISDFFSWPALLPLSLIRHLILLVEFHPLGLELHASLVKSNISISPFLFSSVQLSLRFR